MIKIFDMSNEEWDSIIDNKIIHFTRNYCLAFKDLGDGEPILFYLENEFTKAYQVMLKRKIETQLGEYYDLISPYGYGGWIIEGEYNFELFKEYIEYCKENNIVCEFERFDLFRTDISKYYGNIKFVSHNIVKYVALDDDEIFNNMERRARKNIRKAIKNELSIEIDENFENLDEFKKIYYMTMDRNNATENYYFSNSFFDTITVENSKLFHVKYNGQIISTELVLYDNLCSYSFLGGTYEEFFNLRPTEMLKYEIMKWSAQHNLKYFVLGGGHGADDGIYLYKKGLAPSGVYNFFVGSKIFNEELYKKLCHEKNLTDLDNTFFPLYRKG